MDAWRDLAETITNPDLQAVAAAFVLIACSDGELSSSEVDRFVGVIEGTQPPPAIDATELETRFRALAEEVLANFDDGRRKALAAIEKVRDRAEAADLVVAAARIAIVADGRLVEVEEKILREITTALGRDPEQA